MNDKVKFERRSGIWNVRFPDGKNRSYKNLDLAELAINTFLALNPKYTAVMGDVKSSTKSSSKSKTVLKVALNEPLSLMLDEVVVTAKHLHPEKLDQEGTVVTESKFASEDPFVLDATIRSDLKLSMREGLNWIDRLLGRNYNLNFENAYYGMGNDWFLHPLDYIYPGYFNSDFHKNYREGSDLAGKIIAGYVGSLYGLGKVFELPSTIGEIWLGAKGLYNAYKLNPLFGAYQTFKVAAPTAVGMAAGYGGYKGTDWVSQLLTGKTYGEAFSEGTGLPRWFGDLTNPGGWLGGWLGGLGGYGTYKLGFKSLYSFGRTNLGTRGSRLSYILDSNLNSLEVPQSLNFGKGVKRYKWGDAEFENPNLFYHLDGGDYKGWNYPKVKGAYLKDGYLYPGDSPNAGLLAYSWWNRGDGYWGKDSWNRLIISGNRPEFLHVRSLPYKIGQWDPSKKKSFVTNSEYVASLPVKISPNQVFYFDKYRNGWYRPPARMRYLFGERPSIITTAERMGIPKSERHLRTHGHDYSNPSSYGKLYQNGSVNPESNLFGKFIDEGSEASVFDDPTNPHMVLKVNTDWRGPLLEFYTNYVLKRNRVPNLKPIILRGITEEGFPVFNLEKVTPMTDDLYFLNLPKIREMLHNKGFIGDPEDLGYMSNGVMKIGDFNPGNVAFDSKGNIVFIDIDAYKRGGKINEKR